MQSSNETTQTVRATDDAMDGESDDWTTDLAKLELILSAAKNMLPNNENDAVAKTKSNPLLEELLDKPIHSLSMSDAKQTNGSNSHDEDVTEADGDKGDDAVSSPSDDDSSSLDEDDDADKVGEDEEMGKEVSDDDESKKEETEVKKPKKKQRKVMKSLLRKNIKKILTEKELDLETRAARKEEEDRIKRLQERSQGIQRQRQMQNQITITSAGYTDVCVLSSDDESTISNKRVKRSAEVIDILSDDEDTKKPYYPCSSFANHLYKTSFTVPPLADEDDSFMLDGDNDLNDEQDDVNECGIHTNDDFNVPDEEGRVLVNVGHGHENEKAIYLASHLASRLKPHQIGGIRFLYDNIIESTTKFEESSGYGCILAHSMGLGKTLQLITFIDVFLTNTSAKHVLCIVPINTLQNWIAEFDLWLPASRDRCQFGENGIKYRSFCVFALTDCKTNMSRSEEIISWRQQGGVLLLGYEMYRILTSNQCFVDKRKARGKDEQVEELDPERNSKLVSQMKEALVDPGPDLVVCDEGHRIKNCNAATSKVLKTIRTKRRIVLTGYPLQNNLMEYWCMVDFVRPNYLGNKQEFCNMFERPIQNGQCIDSTPNDRKLMRYRSHVLCSMLRGFVQRRSHSILTKTLPQKHEHVVLVRMTPIQKRLFLGFLDKVKNEPQNNNTLKINPIMLFSVCCKIWNHPDIIHQVINEGKSVDDLDIDVPKIKNRKIKRINKKDLSQPNMMEDVNNVPVIPLAAYPSTSETSSSQRVIDYEWAKPYLVSYTPGVLSNGMKMIVLFEIISQSLALNDRLLVFSQSLYTLNIVEKFLEHSVVPGKSQRWSRNVNYFRLDGSTNAQDRERLINNFNNNENVYLFLLSTRAGCLGINLVGANRIVIFDASWNPCHDAQAACRIYRYGQQKECYIYRLICDNSLEKKVYDRQVSKQGMSHRVVDELNPETNFTWREINSLIYDLEHINEPPVQVFSEELLNSYNDEIIRHICSKMNHCITREPFEHESLLLDHEESKLSKTEKKIAIKSYRQAKKQRELSNHSVAPSTAYVRGCFTPGRGTERIVGRPNNVYLQASQYPQYNTSIYNYPGSLLPVQSTPVPSNIMYNLPMNQSHHYNSNQFANSQEADRRKVRRIVVPQDLSIPVDRTNQKPPIFVPKGEEILIIKTESGMYLETMDGRVVSLRFSPSDFSTIFGQKSANHTNHSSSSFKVTPTSMIASDCPSTSTCPRTPEIIDLSDDDETGNTT